MKQIILPRPSKTPFFSAIDPLDSRYYDPEVAKYLSEESRITYQAYTEAALAHTLAEFGVCSKTIAAQIETASQKVTANAVAEEEKTTRHDIKAVVNTIRAHLPNKAKPYVHFGATSYDIIATANALQTKNAINSIILPRLTLLMQTLIKLTEKYAETIQVGRTHGQHAVPITFGFAISEYVSRLGNSMVAIEALTQQLHGKFSGAVGAYNALSTFVKDPILFEKSLLKKLDLEPAEYSNQIVPPEAMIRLMDELTIVAGIMANLAHDMRHLQRSEIGEVRERFEKGQTGSSTMAHKRNPWNFENVVSMHKQVLAQSMNANLNIASEHQRDLTDSASSRFYAVAIGSVAAMTKRLDRIMSKLEVDEIAMERNLTLTTGAIAAEPLYLLLAKYGHAQAHEKSKALSHQAIAKGISLVESIEQDREAHTYWLEFNEQEQNIIIEPERYYTGKSSKKAKNIVKTWQKYLT